MVDRYTPSNILRLSTTNSTRKPFTIDEMNDIVALTRYGAIIFIGILMFLGVIGNMHVIYIYYKKFRRSNRRIYIISLASLDLFTSAVAMPYVIAEQRNPLKFDYPIVCKTFKFLTYTMSIGSICIIVVIAIDRYQKICRPLRAYFTVKQAKYACLVCLLIAVGFSWPALVLFGRSDFKVNGIVGVTCFTEDRYKNTYYQVYFMAALSCFVFVCGCILVLIYGKLRYHLSKLNRSTFYTRNVCTLHSTLPRQPLNSEGTAAPPAVFGCDDSECDSDCMLHDVPPENCKAGDKVTQYNVNKEDSNVCEQKEESSDKMANENNTGTNKENDVPENIGKPGLLNIPSRTLHANDTEHAETKNGAQPLVNTASDMLLNRSTKADVGHTDNVCTERGKSPERPDLCSKSNSEKSNGLSSSGSSMPLKIRLGNGKHGKQYVRTLKTTKINLMLSLIAFVFFVSFIPHLVLATILFADLDIYLNLDLISLFLYNTFLWTHFINNMANPIVYGFCDAKFRTECINLYRKTIFHEKKRHFVYKVHCAD